MEPHITKGEDGVPFIRVDDEHFLKFDLDELDEDFKERARIELRESPENVEAGINGLKKLIENEKTLHLPLDVEYLNKFLRPCKFYPESAFKLLKKYYKFLAKHPKYTSDLMPSTVEKVFHEEIIEFLPFRVNGSRVMVINVGNNWHPKDVQVSLLFKTVIMALEIAMGEPKTQVAGVHVILDLENLSLGHIFEFSPMLAKVIMDFVQECIPVRLKGIHIVNQPYIFNMGYAIFKPFIGEKLRKRLFFHGTKWDEFMKHIPAEQMLTKYGGNLELPHTSGSLLVELLKHFEKEYEELSHFGYNKKVVE